jgi:alkylhydroperoxidase/carboxymuconolactone decarboxylase family protein YurZ
MTNAWTTERIEALSTLDIKQLRANALVRKNALVVEMCDQVLEGRRAKPKATRSSGISRAKGIPKKERSSRARELEKTVAKQLADFAATSLAAYDLSKKTARELSANTKHFIAHGLTSANGQAKIGGSQRLNETVFDRYISYRLNDSIYALSCVLIDGDNPDDILYQVIAPKELLASPEEIAATRPYMDVLGAVGPKHLQTFEGFGEACFFYNKVMDKIANKI